MLESILTISVAGLVAGFIFSMPIAGPISILITSNALKGRLRYCILVSIGASIADFTYVFIAVFGLTKLYSLYKPAIPYIFAMGSLFFLYLGYRIIRTKIDIENLEDKSHLTEKIQKKGKGGFFTGLMINFLNPTLFIGVLTSSFFVISLIAALGLNTGGLAGKMDQNLKEISVIEGGVLDNSNVLTIDKFDNIQNLTGKTHHQDQTIYPAYFHLVISTCYAVFLSLGSIIWLYMLSYLIVRFRQRINIRIVTVFIRSLGIVLSIFGLFFAYLSVRMLLLNQ
ncbi:MAG: LysE family transporter [Bacteroidales bacterium]|nr:LysE family transporter [Bacteroidales bacterium]